jgi:hypothetical protein
LIKGEGAMVNDEFTPFQFHLFSRAEQSNGRMNRIKNHPSGLIHSLGRIDFVNINFVAIFLRGFVPNDFLGKFYIDI